LLSLTIQIHPHLSHYTVRPIALLYSVCVQQNYLWCYHFICANVRTVMTGWFTACHLLSTSTQLGSFTWHFTILTLLCVLIVSLVFSCVSDCYVATYNLWCRRASTTTPTSTLALFALRYAIMERISTVNGSISCVTHCMCSVLALNQALFVPITVELGYNVIKGTEYFVSL
jgi:hypothetical protein